MLIGALGHGCYSVVSGGVHVLVDPLLTRTFLRGTSEPFPRREIDLDRLPPVDAIFLTHNHPGHLEPESLDGLPRGVPVFAPADPTITLVLTKMGFTSQNVVRSGMRATLGGGSITFVGGWDGYVSAVFDDADGRFWYLGDRGDFFSPATIEATIVDRPVDVALVSHPSDFHSYLQRSTWDGGAQDGESHADWLARSVQVALAIRASLSVPGSTSNRYLGDAAWLNRYVFPMRPQEFADRLTELGSPATALEPGDAVLVDRGAIKIERGGLPYVKRLPAVEDRGLDPTATVPDVVDHNPEGVARAELARRCERYLTETLASWAASRSGPCAADLARMHRVGLSYRVVVVFTDRSTASWRLVLRDWHVEVTSVGADTPAAYGELTLRIPASVLDRWSRNEIPYFEAGVQCRRAGQAYAIGLRTDGTVSAAPVPLRDLVTLHLTASTAAHHDWLVRTYWPGDA